MALVSGFFRDFKILYHNYDNENHKYDKSYAVLRSPYGTDTRSESPLYSRKMPYKLRKAPNRPLYWVVAEDGRHMSKEPIPYERAIRQMKALYARVRR